MVTSCSKKEPENKIKFHLQNSAIFIFSAAEKYIETDLKTTSFTDPQLMSVFLINC